MLAIYSASKFSAFMSYLAANAKPKLRALYADALKAALAPDRTDEFKLDAGRCIYRIMLNEIEKLESPEGVIADGPLSDEIEGIRIEFENSRTYAQILKQLKASPDTSGSHYVQSLERFLKGNPSFARADSQEDDPTLALLGGRNKRFLKEIHQATH